MRIAYFAPRFLPESDAAGERVAGLASRWVRAGHDVVVVTGAAERRVLQREWCEGALVLRTSVVPIAIATAEVRAADVVIAMSWPPAWPLAGWGLAAALRVPFVLEQQGARDVPRFLRRRAALVVSRSAFDEDALVVPDGVDLRRCVPAPRDAALRAELGLGDEHVVVGLGPHARVHLLEAARRLADVDDIRFVTVGHGAAPSNVTFVSAPRRERIDRLAAAADVVMVTAFDPLSLVLEHMARARPVLLVGRGEAAAIVEAAGAGWVVSRDDASALADAIREAHADPAGTWTRGEIGRQYVAEHFDGDRLAETYLASLRRVVETRGAV